MNTKQIIAGISVATVLAMAAPTYAGGLMGGIGGMGGLSGAGGIAGTNRFGSIGGQGAFDGQGAANASFDRLHSDRAAGDAKQTTNKAARAPDAAKRSGDGTAKTAKGSVAGAANAAGQMTSATDTPSKSAPAAQPARQPASTSVMGSSTDSVGTENSRGDHAVSAGGEGSASFSRN